jgi:hypothetical protein
VVSNLRPMQGDLMTYMGSRILVKSLHSHDMCLNYILANQG